MNTMIILSRMEVDGIGVNCHRLQGLANTLKSHTELLEKKAYQYAGRRFSFTSSADVAKALGIYKGKKCSTNKQVLEQNNSPLSNVILQWRKLNSTLTKMVYPLLRLVRNNRIHGTCITRNATGRISMHEPNLQNVPRDFDFENPFTTEKTLVSCRSSFVPAGSNVMLSVDYCQLELRILADATKDSSLCAVMKDKNKDIFKSIAARCNNILETEVNTQFFL